MKLRRYTQILGRAYKVLLLPDRELEPGKSAHIDHDDRVVFLRDDVTPTLQRHILDAVRRQCDRKWGDGKEAA